MGNHVRDMHMPTERPNACGTAWWVAFSPDDTQQNLDVAETDFGRRVQRFVLVPE